MTEPIPIESAIAGQAAAFQCLLTTLLANQAFTVREAKDVIIASSAERIQKSDPEAARYILEVLGDMPWDGFAELEAVDSVEPDPDRAN